MLVAVLLLSALACGSGGGDLVATTENPGDVVETTVAAGTAQVSISYDMAAARADAARQIEDLGLEPRRDLAELIPDRQFEGTVDLAAQRIHLVSTADGASDDTTLEVYVDRTRAYSRRGDEGWRYRELGSIAGESGWEQASPAAALAVLAGSRPLELLGADEVRGSPVTHYRTTSGTEDDQDTVEVWVDEAGRAVRIRTTPRSPAETSGFGTGEGGGASLSSRVGLQGAASTTDFWDFGLAFDVTAPVGAVPDEP